MLDLPDNTQIDILGRNLRLRIYDDFKPIHKYLSQFSSSSVFFDDFDNIVDKQYILVKSVEKLSLNQAIKFLKNDVDGQPIIRAIRNYIATIDIM